MNIKTTKEICDESDYIFDNDFSSENPDKLIKFNTKEWVSAESILPSLYELRTKLREKRINVAGLGNIQARLDQIINGLEEKEKILMNLKNRRGY